MVDKNRTLIWDISSSAYNAFMLNGGKERQPKFIGYVSSGISTFDVIDCGTHLLFQMYNGDKHIANNDFRVMYGVYKSCTGFESAVGNKIKQMVKLGNDVLNTSDIFGIISVGALSAYDTGLNYDGIRVLKVAPSLIDICSSIQEMGKFIDALNIYKMIEISAREGISKAPEYISKEFGDKNLVSTFADYKPMQSTLDLMHKVKYLNQDKSNVSFYINKQQILSEGIEYIGRDCIKTVDELGFSEEDLFDLWVGGLIQRANKFKMDTNTLRTRAKGKTHIDGIKYTCRGGNIYVKIKE